MEISEFGGGEECGLLGGHCGKLNGGKCRSMIRIETR